jgi:hypothetical protein
VYFVSRTQIIVALGAVGLALYVLDLVRRRRLSEEYSLLWVVCTTAIAVLGFSTPVLLWVTQLLGMYGAASTAYSFGLMFAVVMLLYLSVKLSRLGAENQALARELALLRFDLDRATSGRAPGKDAW